MKTMEKVAQQQEAKEALLELIKPGDTVYTVLRSVSRSGMFRRLDCYVMKDNQPLFITGRVAQLIPCRYTTENWRQSAGLGVSGCGMDMGYHVVHSLSNVLFQQQDMPYSHEAAYALKHQWI